MTISHHIEPADRPYTVALSADELRAVIRYHALYNRVLERELPNLVNEHCKDAPHGREAVVALGARQLMAHEARRAELEGILTEGGLEEVATKEVAP